MKKLVLSSVSIFLGINLLAQLPVSQVPQKRKAMIEEFTGINCGACPNAHLSADQVVASKPAGDVIVVAIHTGPYSTPYNSQPDYRTPEGNILATQIPSLTISSYPDATVNRRTATWGVPNKNASYNIYGYFSDQVLSENSPVNIAVQGTVDVNTRVLSVQSEVYYTANSIAPTNSIVVELIENWVVGPQSNGAAIYPAMANSNGTYNHQHMLRKIISSNVFGDAVSPTTAGTKHTLTYTYTVPSTFGTGAYVNNCNLNNLKLVAYVIDKDWEIRTAAYGPIAQNASTASIKEENGLMNGLNVFPNPAKDHVTLSFDSKQDEKVKLNVVNSIGELVYNSEINLEIGENSIEINTADWAEGAYSINLSGSNTQLNKKLLVIK